MSQQPIEANVVLTSDNSQYDSSMQASAAQTDQFGKSVDSLGAKIDRLAKSAGKKMFGIAGADVAVITAATASYAAFERQMTSLSAQAAVLNRSMSDQKSTMGSYTASVNTLRQSFGTSTQEAAQLVQVLSRVQDQTSSVDRLANTFTKLGAATQESSIGLATSMLQLQKSMGTSQRDTSKYANQLTVLSKTTNASAQGILEFANQLAPVGRLVNMSQTDIMGISTAFQKSGQDGMQAANVFSKMMTDVAYASQTGSPALSKYANLVGMTVDQFKGMGGTDQFVKIFEAINRQGPAAITTLNRMGLDGMRTVRSVTAMAQQSGGIQQAITQARGADPDALNRGSSAAMSGITDSLKRIRSELALTGESFGSRFAGPAKVFLGTMQNIASAIRAITNGPLGSLAAGIAGVAAPFLAVAGAITVASKALLLFAGANSVLRNSATFGFREGRQGFGAIGQAGRPLGPEGLAMAGGVKGVRGGNWVQRGMFNAGARIGGLMPAGTGAGGPGLLSRATGYALTGAGGAAGMGARLIGYQYSPGTLRGLDSPTERERVFSNQTMRGSMQSGWAAGRGFLFQNANNQVTGGGFGQGGMNGMNSVAQAAANATKGLNQAGDSAMSAGRGFRNALSSVSRGMAYTGGMATSTAGGAAVMAGRGVGAVGRSLGGLFMSNPWMMAAGLGLGAYSIAHGAKQNLGSYSTPDNTGMANAYLTAGGLTPAASFTPSRAAKNTNVTLDQARNISSADAFAASDSAYRLNEPRLNQFKNDPKQALEMLAPKMAGMRKNPKAINALAMDLAAVYGRGTAQSMLSSLLSGTASQEGAGSLVSEALNQKQAKGWKNKVLFTYWGEESKGDVSKAWGNTFGAYKDRVDFIAQTQGEKAGARAQGDAFGDAAMRVGRQAGAGFNPSTTQTENGAITFDKNKTERTSFFQNQFKSIGIDLTEKEARALRIDPDAKSAAGGRRGVIESAYGDDVPESVRKKLRSQYGVNDKLSEAKQIEKILDAMMGSGIAVAGTDVDQRIAGLRTAGGRAMGTMGARRARDEPENVNLQLESVTSLTRALKDQGLTAAQITKQMGDVVATVGDVTDPRSIQAQQVSQMSQRQLGYQMPTMSRTDQFAAQTGQFKAAMSIIPGSETQAQDQLAAQDTFAQQAESQRQFFVGLLYQQREYNIQRDRSEDDFAVQRDRMDTQFNLQRQRAQDDFHQQRHWQEQDFELQRERAEANFDRQRNRANYNYDKSVRRGRESFNLQRLRQEQDFQHQVVMMTEQAAKSQLNIYERTAVQRTSSAGWMLFNAGDQLKQMKDQEANLDKLRGAGMNDKTIQQLDLTNPQNAQQLARMVTDVANDPSMVKKFNEAISERLKAAGALVTDESSKDWQEFNRQYRLARSRGKQDFDKVNKQNREDFLLSMKQQEQDFRRSMNEQGDDYDKAQKRANIVFDTGMDRQQTDYNTAVDNMVTDFGKSMDRAAADLARAADTIDGNLEDILAKAMKNLGGHAKTQAGQVLKEFRNLKKDTTPEAVALMEALSDIFGIKYTPPKSYTTSIGGDKHGGGARSATGGHEAPTRSSATGGVLPGFTPGTDVHTFHSPTAGTLNLSGGEAIMRPEWTRMVGGEKAVQEMNNAARRGVRQGFKEGGVYWPVPGHNTGTYKGHDGVDINRGSGWDDFGDPIRAARGGRVSYVGTGHGYGEAIFIKTPGGPTQIYGHTSGQAVHTGQSVQAGQLIGRVGNTGHSTAPHLHFGITPGLTYSSAMAFLNGAQMSVPDGQMLTSGGGGTVAAILKDRYRNLEANIAGMQGIKPFKPGQYSKLINRLARGAARQMGRNAQMSEDIAAGLPAFSPTGGEELAGNRGIGKQMNAAHGWAQYWPALLQLWNNESGWNHQADNPTSSAYGIPQALVKYPGRKMPAGYYAGGRGEGSNFHGFGGDPRVQIKWGLDYIKSAYGNPGRALSKWQSRSPHWYGDGGIFGGGAQTIGVGERGPEMVLPLNEKGSDFLASLMDRMSSGLEGRGANTQGYTQPVVSHTTNHYKIDRSTTFSGAITVQANDPNQFVSTLRSRQRASALTNPVLAGRH